MTVFLFVHFNLCRTLMISKNLLKQVESDCNIYYEVHQISCVFCAGDFPKIWSVLVYTIFKIPLCDGIDHGFIENAIFEDCFSTSWSRFQFRVNFKIQNLTCRTESWHWLLFQASNISWSKMSCRSCNCTDYWLRFQTFGSYFFWRSPIEEACESKP
jgi:hypothetical protein